MNHRVINTVMLILSVVFATGISELAYRLYLASTLHTSIEEPIPKHALNYRIHNEAPTRFDQDYGYTYVPSERFLDVKIRQGYPVLCNSVEVNALGNTDHVKRKDDEPAFKLLVFGDSFTANSQHDGLTWPGLLQQTLEAKGAGSAHVMNFGRDAYGVLQMFDLAAGVVEKYRPDLVILAFITNDLHRGRFWHVQKTIDGQTRYFVTTKPTEMLDPSSSVDVALIHPGITQAWCEDLLATQRDDDPLLFELNRTFWQRRVEHDRKVNVYALSRSFLFHRIVHRDPFYGVKRLSRVPKMPLRDFRLDAKMMDNIETLKQADIPYVLIHLPRYEELKAGRYLLNDQQRALRSSLATATGREIIEVFDAVADSVEDNAALFLLPEDPHPSVAGMQRYATAVCDALIERGLVEYDQSTLHERSD